jgi:hypothetical protein
MIDMMKTLTITTAAVLAAVLMGIWLASTTPALSGAEENSASTSVNVRLSSAELDLCSGQAWPHFSQGCASWISASSDSHGIDRTISLAVHDVDHGFTVVSKAEPVEVAAR